jgi:hypothetical protein
VTVRETEAPILAYRHEVKVNLSSEEASKLADIFAWLARFKRWRIHGRSAISAHNRGQTRRQAAASLPFITGVK